MRLYMNGILEYADDLLSYAARSHKALGVSTLEDIHVFFCMGATVNANQLGASAGVGNRSIFLCYNMSMWLCRLIG